MIAKIVSWVKSRVYEFFLVGVVVLIAVISYNLGRIKVSAKPALKVGQDATIFNAVSGSAGGSNPAGSSGAGESSGPKPILKTPALVPVRDLRVVVSKTSDSKKYHYSWCSGAKQIKPENQIWFATAQAAEAAGYTLAGNCKYQ